jgi:hypothetical protein
MSTLNPLLIREHYNYLSKAWFMLFSQEYSSPDSHMAWFSPLSEM